MLPKEKIQRINYLSKKSKESGLTIEEAKEQTALRKEYLDTFREHMRKTIENVRVFDPNGDEVTPEKVRAIQKRKGPLN
ncbi:MULTISPECIES: DUF896 domain-containing protein [Rummeliibacillus]|jgi:uncharacterized protein YnzC (UPF0291/DUF896 family)|uniref:DUF896 domain-containing protein n=1 Tax=Rummeliibacillus TaxID=648802 RepID=UPI0011B364C9|nr:MULTISPECIES: DUF896 domain-containing protein [Rummeliibacillus]MBO2534682.1 DUF896 domain-containing protein [Rummeliibacillus suwonensis]